MSHFSVLVALRPTDPKRIDDALAEALAPFSENREVTPYFDYETGKPGEHWSVSGARKDGLLPAEGELTWQQVADVYHSRYEITPDSSEYLHVDADGRAYSVSAYNPHSKWDWYQIGGRWNGYFPVKPEAAGDPRLIAGAPGVGGRPCRDGWCDGGPRGLLDFEALRKARATEAANEYDRWTALVDGLPEARPWSHFLGLHEANPDGYPIVRAREEYGAQPRVRKARMSDDLCWFDDIITHFSPSRDAYAQRAAEQAVPGYAFLDLDGVWHAPGRMGWFGMSSDTEDDRAAYLRQMNERLDALDPATFLIAVDCHI